MPAETAGLHHFHVDSVGQHCDIAAADQALVLCLGHHRSANREQHNHDGYTQAEAQ